MTTETNDLSTTVTRISSLWKGYRVRKVFTDLKTVDNWDDYDNKYFVFECDICRSEAHKNEVIAWQVALRLADERICELSRANHYDVYYEYDDPEPDWHWNDGSGYNDW